MDLLEREPDLTVLRDRLADAERGAGQIILLGGEAGSGKSSLVWRFAAEIGDRAVSLIGACDGLSTPQPLGPLVDIAGALNGRTAGLIWSGAPRPHIFRAALDDLAGAERTPVVVIEDAHWADEATLDLLRFAGRRWRSIGALLIVTYRDDEAGARHPLRAVLGELSSAPYVHRLSLAPLSREAVERLAAGRAVDAAELYRLTRGNPFFVTEVLAAGTAGIPPSVRDAVLARGARLAAPARAVLDAAAVLGSPLESSLLALVAESDAVAIDACLASGMLLEGEGRLRFRHELARQAIHDAIGPARRAALHRRALEIMTTGGIVSAAPDRLAYHAEEAGDREAVLRYAALAAERASALGAHRDAAAQYERMLRFAGRLPPAERAELLERHSYETYLIGRWQEAIRSREEAVALWRSLGDRLKEGENERWLGRISWSSGWRPLAEEAVGRAIALLETLPPGRELAMALSLQVSLAMLGGHTGEAAALGERALAVADAIGDEQSHIHILNSLGTNLLSQGDETGRPLLEESMRRAREAGDDEAVDRVWVNLGCPAVHHFQFARAEVYLNDGIAYAQDHDFESSRLYLSAWQAMMRMHQGEWTWAETTASPLVRLSADSPVDHVVALSVLGRLRARRGEAGARELLDQACELAAPADDICHINPAFAGSAEAAWLAGDRERAIADASRLLPRALDSGNRWWIGDPALTLWLAGVTDLPVESCAPPFRMQIEGDWAGAAAAWTELGCPYQAALALADGDEAALRQALAAFEALGAQPMIDETVRRLRALGVRAIPRSRVTSGPPEEPFGVTPREREVLQLLSEGFSDRDIAEALFIGPGTVRTHLTSLFNKLDVKSRTAAIAVARRGGLL